MLGVCYLYITFYVTYSMASFPLNKGILEDYC